MKNRIQKEKGQAILEFALVMPLLILLLLGVVYFAMAFNLQMVLNAAVREGASAWASNRGNTSPCKVTDTTSCDPFDKATGFGKNVVPLVQKYISDNGYDPKNNMVFDSVKKFNDEQPIENWNKISDSAEDPTKVKLSITYFYTIPGLSFKFTQIPLTATCTMKKGT